MQALRDLARRVSSLSWFRPALAGLAGGLVACALLPPEGARALGRFFYDYQILMTGLAAIAAAGVTYRAALRQMRFEREKEERSRQNRSYALILEMLPKIHRINARVIEKIALIGVLSGNQKHILALRELDKGAEDIKRVSLEYTWRDLSDFNPAITPKFSLFVHALEEFHRSVNALARPMGGTHSPEAQRSQAAVKVLEALGRVVTDLHYSLSEELEALALALDVHTATVQLAKAVHERIRTEIEAEEDSRRDVP